jgi:hypothetical protein
VKGEFMLSHIFLFGHRQQHGKDTCCALLEKVFLEKKISYCKTFFAKLLKKQVAEKYNLDANKMEFNDYKISKPEHLGGLTVREILIKEGCAARAIWNDTWANSVYQEIFNSNSQIGIVSDFRYPNEYSCFERSFDYWKSKSLSLEDKKKQTVTKPKVIRILVHRPHGVFKNDGADSELPDNENPDAWEYIIINEDHGGWEKRLEDQVVGIMQMEKIL